MSPPLPPGSNLLCHGDAPGAERRRREWDRLDDHDRALYLDAVETAIERGLHQRFAQFHANEMSDVQERVINVTFFASPFTIF